jgi:hypothetical protein
MKEGSPEGALFRSINRTSWLSPRSGGGRFPGGIDAQLALSRSYVDNTIIHQFVAQIQSAAIWLRNRAIPERLARRGESGSKRVTWTVSLVRCNMGTFRLRDCLEILEITLNNLYS